MKWKRHGVLWAPPGDLATARSHASLPTPMLLSDGLVRVFVTCRDSLGRGRPFWVDLDVQREPTLVRVSTGPALDLGKAGTFDQDGVACTSVLAMLDGTVRMYYAGFELLTRIRYRILTGVAISWDGGDSFSRQSQVPLLERSEEQLAFRCGASVWPSDDSFRMYYVGGSDWTELAGRQVPSYELFVTESTSPSVWPSPGRKILPVDDLCAAYGRPWPLQLPNGISLLLFSVRDRALGEYRMASAPLSADGSLGPLEMGIGLEPPERTYASSVTLHAATITVEGRTWCFYNGDDFGRDGFAVAELVEC